MFKGFISKKGSNDENRELPCPNCKKPVNLSMERCPGCGVRVASMFRIECPKCGTMNKLDAKECEKCKKFLGVIEEEGKGKEFICPLCGYKMKTLLSQCPGCDARFM